MPAKPVEGRRLNEYQAVPRDALALRARARVNRGVEAIGKVEFGTFFKNLAQEIQRVASPKNWC